VARSSVGDTSAWGRRPPRRHPAIVWASIVSGVALPPWMACMESAWPRTTGMPARGQRAASQSQVQRPCDADHPGLAVRCHRLEKRFRPCWPVPVEQDRSRLVQDAEIHGAGVHVETTITLVRLRIESPEVSSS
jgi:hypothetical protein